MLFLFCFNYWKILTKQKTLEWLSRFVETGLCFSSGCIHSCFFCYLVFLFLLLILLQCAQASRVLHYERLYVLCHSLFWIIPLNDCVSLCMPIWLVLGDWDFYFYPISNLQLVVHAKMSLQTLSTLVLNVVSFVSTVCFHTFKWCGLFVLDGEFVSL